MSAESGGVSILRDGVGVLTAESAAELLAEVSTQVEVTVPAQDLMWAVGAVQRHRAKPPKDTPMRFANCLFVAVEPDHEPEPRAVVGATNHYSAALATTTSRDGEGEPYLSPDDPSDVWKDLALPAGLFTDPASAGVFDADKAPVRDIDRLAEGDHDADITLTLGRWNLRVSGPAGYLNWPRINPPATLFDTEADASLIPDLTTLFADIEAQLPVTPQGHDITYQTALLRVMEDLSGPNGQLRFAQPASGLMVLVTAKNARTPRIALIGPHRTTPDAEDHV